MTDNGDSVATRTKRPGPARDKLLKAASKRFYAFGLTATGIDAVTADAGVAKKSLYNNFSSKSDLIAAYLHERHEEWLELYRRRLDAADSPLDRLLAVFDAYTDHALLEYEHGFRGCGLLNAAAELPVGDPGRAVVRRHKEEVESLLATHLGELDREGPSRNPAMAEHLAFLLEGAVVRAGLEGNDRCLRNARQMARQMVSTL
jgi:AcrR family transcriptional regulator